MAQNTLGCGRYTAQIWTRGGGSCLFTGLPVTTCSWTRVLDDTSEAQANMAGLGRTPACFAAIRNAEPFAFELALVRSGVVVWQGPIVDSGSEGSTGNYDARDLSSWWDRRKVSVDIDVADTDLATIFQSLHTAAMAEDTSPNFTVTTTPTGIFGTRKYLAGQHLLAGPLMRELASSGIDFTVVGRQAIVGGSVVPTDPIARLDDRHIVKPPSVKKDGATMATRVTIVGAGGGDGPAPIVGIAQDDAAIAIYGLIDSVQQNDNIRDSDSAQAAAETALAISQVPAVVGSDVTIDSDAPVLIEQMVPGALIAVALRTSGIEVAGTFRLQKVTVGAQHGAETVSVTLQPVGTTTQLEGGS